MRPTTLTAITLTLALGSAGCATSAPHTAAAAGINTGLALAVGAAGRSSGGCWAVCTDGLVCNPASGWCEKPLPQPVTGCPAGASSGDPRCAGWPAPTIKQSLPPSAAVPGTAPVGISPATGTAPPPPAEASPGGPPRP